MIEKRSTVTIHYTLKVDGKVVDTSQGKEPLVYVHGSGQIIPGLEEQLAGLHKGARRSIQVEPEKGYGSVDPKATRKVPRTLFQTSEGLEIGDVVKGQSSQGNFEASVKEIGKDEIVLDMNHPLAGKTLYFDVEVLEVAPPQA